MLPASKREKFSCYNLKLCKVLVTKVGYSSVKQHKLLPQNDDATYVPMNSMWSLLAQLAL